ncbi:MAG TPA: aspartate kinase [Candidatus Binataceae bacterium]|nr:aspartate kinase [Candidatus Binataceae bacterium]
MALVVQKYGGTSVGSTERIKAVADRVARARARGDRIVVVVSAMAGETNRLFALAGELSDNPSARETDVLVATGEQVSAALLAIRLRALGYPTVSFLAYQLSIVTDGQHGGARIKSIDCGRLHAALETGNIAVVAGYQGISPAGDITTLGRGASDLTAVALAAVLKADACEIYTDVDGVYTADPRLVPNARKLTEISYDEMLELASLGAKVMQSRSVEFAKKFGVVFEVRSSLNENPGTIVKEETKSMEEVVVRGVALDKNQAKITLVGVPDKPGVAARIFKALGDATVNVDMIVQNISHGTGTPQTDISFTTEKADLLKAQKVIDGLKKDIGIREVITDEKIGKLSIVGVGMKSHTGVAGKMFQVLAQEGVNIGMISTSEIKISVTIDLAKGEAATKAVHTAFIG